MRPVRRLVLLVALVPPLAAPAAAQESPLTVEQIMQDPDTWVGAWPSSLRWSEDGRTVYFNWNPGGAFESDSLFMVARTGGEAAPVPPAARRALRTTFGGWRHGDHVYDADFSRKVIVDDGDLFVVERRTGAARRLTRTRAYEGGARFGAGGEHVVYERDDNLYRHHLADGLVEQITDLRSGTGPQDERTTPQSDFLETQQQALFEVLRTRRADDEARDAAREREAEAAGGAVVHYYGRGRLTGLALDPTERFVTYSAVVSEDDPPTEVQNYVTESGYAEMLRARPKVGGPEGARDLHILDLVRDTSYAVDLTTLPGLNDRRTYGETVALDVDSSAARDVSIYGPSWSPDGRYAVLDVRSADNKDRWLVRLDPETGGVAVLDRQTDDAWIAGPGVSWWSGATGWYPDGHRFYFQSERTGHSHLYAVDVATGAVEALTSGDFEVFDPVLSRDGRTWTFTSSETSPFDRHVYRMPADGGPRERLTTLDGWNEAAVSPDGTVLALLHSTPNRPPEVYLQPVGGTARRVTDSPTDAWTDYTWRTGEIEWFEASDGVDVPAQVFRPATPNGAAVLFVHGAGYLQNVHRGWSSYFREYMFHNLLADQGYTVVNVDYRGSAGYGRDWRTAIYRHMGGRDLQDYVDASRWLGETEGIDPERVFIYGGSYGGFITLMALFTEPEHFGGGAALRSVTDWAHYNHGYTSNILNTPAEDSLAFARSSPIYFAEGLEDPLLIAHGMVDTNVQFQDVVRLAQRLIELGKEDWEMAVYPVEGHGFVEPTSWADEYRRILETIEASVGPNAPGVAPEIERIEVR